MIPLYDNQPTRSFPIVTILLIVVNLVVFAGWQIGVGLEKSVQLAALVPVQLTTAPSQHTLNIFTSMFMHGGWMHVIGNMWFLWIFGNNIEDATGHVRYVLFYLLCGAAAALAHVAFRPDSPVPMVGASGAVSGVLGAYLLLHPHARVLTFIPLGPFLRLTEVPAYLFLFIWIGLQIVSQLAMATRGTGAGVAYLAHIGGFVAGLALIPLFRARRRPPAAWD